MSASVIFNALGDPVRLELVRRLSQERHQRVTAITSGLGLTRQGARRHLQVLVEANIVKLEPVGRDVWVELDPKSLDAAKEFMRSLEVEWDRRLDALKRSLESE